MAEAIFGTVSSYLTDLSRQLKYRCNEIPPFIEKYKQSWVYWSTSFIGGLFGVLSQSSWRPYSTATLVMIFLIPPVLYYWENQPFAISCTYRSIDHDTGKTNIREESNKVATPSGDGFEIDLEIEINDQIEDLSMAFCPPEGAPITFVDEYGSWDNFDYVEDVYRVEGAEADKWTVAVYLENDGLETTSDESFEVKEMNSGRIIESIDLHSQ